MACPRGRFFCSAAVRRPGARGRSWLPRKSHAPPLRGAGARMGRVWVGGSRRRTEDDHARGHGRLKSASPCSRSLVGRGRVFHSCSGRTLVGQACRHGQSAWHHVPIIDTRGAFNLLDGSVESRSAHEETGAPVLEGGAASRHHARRAAHAQRGCSYRQTASIADSSDPATVKLVKGVCS